MIHSCEYLNLEYLKSAFLIQKFLCLQKIAEVNRKKLNSPQLYETRQQ